MKQSALTRVLYVDKDGDLQLGQYHGTKHELDNLVDGRVVLVGGYPSKTDEQSIPLSPTLQLNSDLTSLESGILHKIAEAELLRTQAVKQRSFVTDVTYHVCVVSDDVTALEKFIDTYGGILEIDPVLVKGESSDFREAVELHVDRKEAGLAITVRRRAPINTETCIYCGQCGQSCPEKCITPDLFIDSVACTLCKECEKNCPVGAIDIHGVEEQIIHVPSLIILGTLQLQLPGNTSGIYRESELDTYFSTLFESEIKEVVCHNSRICQYSAKLKMGCGRCIASCPHGALSRSGTGVEIDHSRCEECGNCVAVCPTGAMQIGMFEDPELVTYLGSLGGSVGTHLIIGEEEDLLSLWWYGAKQVAEEVFFLEYPSVHSLSSYHFLLFFIFGFSKITVVQTRHRDDSSILVEEINKANAILNGLYGIHSIELKMSDEIDLSAPEETAHPFAGITDISHQNRRKGLVQMLQLMLSTTQKEVDLSSADFDFTMVTCDDQRCTHCMACLNDCKTQALSADQSSLSLTYSAGLCVGCGVCAGVCPENVLSLSKVTTIDSEFFKSKELAHSEAAKCKKCGKVFGARKSLDRVMQILSAKENVNTDHFEYCGTCRVVNLFEAQET